MSLNEEQRRAVRHYGKPLLVVAGAGSGKTRTLVHKVEYLIKERGLSPESILCITFTNKAAEEIRERIRKSLGVELPWSGTFHSIALKILRREHKALGLPKNFTVADESDSLQLLKEVLGRLGIKKEPKEVKEELSRTLEGLRDPGGELALINDLYRKALRENSLLDFTDLMVELYNLLQREEIREKYRKLFKYILVDEYQDTNRIQYEILKLLSNGNICVIGDPNQCIYEWREARPENVLSFIEDFRPDILKLERNYRSTENILRVANAILKKSSTGWKELIPLLKGVRGEGKKPEVRRFPDEEEEALWILKKIRELGRDYSYEDFAILVRASFITDVYERTFFRAGIPYQVLGALRFYERAEVKNLIAVLRLVANPSEELSFRRVLEVFVKGVGEKGLEKIRKHYRGNWLRASADSLKKLKGEAALGLYNFLKAISPLYRNPEKYHEGMETFVERVGYLEILKRKYKKDWEERWDNVQEFLKSLKDFYRKAYTLEELLSEVSLSSQEEEKKGVKILTIHSAKGLEFPVVFLPRLEEGILPHRKSLESEKELEEERRLFYVAVTRAKDLLFLTYTKKEGRRPSRFLSDIPKAYLDLSAFRKKKVKYEKELTPNNTLRRGDKVFHRVFGRGTVLAVQGERVKVRFEEGEEKVIHSAFLERLKTL
ncbi:MAG: UvrD-helicase domain-containing protein [Aquificae bacterium]|nr:UvrD-helicase domain-containing protein [Aquificota bacterium]